MRILKIYEEFNSNVNEHGLIEQLNQYGIKTDAWGTGNAKTVRHLLNELNGKECSIVEENGTLVRYIEFIGVKIYYNDEVGNNWILNEDHQVFKDGRVRRRKMQSSVSEKMKSGEDPFESAIRGIAEELEIKVTREQIIFKRDISFDSDSQSYPGLETKYKGYQYWCYFTKEQYKEEGYVEHQEDKSTYFRWVKRN